MLRIKVNKLICIHEQWYFENDIELCLNGKIKLLLKWEYRYTFENFEGYTFKLFIFTSLLLCIKSILLKWSTIFLTQNQVVFFVQNTLFHSNDISVHTNAKIQFRIYVLEVTKWSFSRNMKRYEACYNILH